MSKCNYCIVCRSDKENGECRQELNSSLYRFPKSPRRKEKWIQQLNLIKTSIKSGTRVCELHFAKSQIVRTKLKPDAIPSLTPHLEMVQPIKKIKPRTLILVPNT